jgi:hypothetical protein
MHLSTRQYCGTPADCLPHTQPICRPIGLSDLRADVAEQVGDVVLDELVVHNRLPVRVEQPLELVDLLLLVRLGEQQRVLCGTYSRRTQRKDLLLLASLRATQPIGPTLEPIDTAHRSVTSCDNTWWLTLVETAMESSHTIGTGRYGGTAYYGVLKGHRGVL